MHLFIIKYNGFKCTEVEYIIYRKLNIFYYKYLSYLTYDIKKNKYLNVIRELF